VAHTCVAAAVLPFQRTLTRIENPTAFRIIDHVIEVLQTLFLDELPEDIDVAVGLGVCREDVVVRDDDHPFGIPHLGPAPKLALEHSDRSRSAHVVRHEQVRFHPHVLPGNDARFARRPCQQFLAQCHILRNTLATLLSRRK
jgi:hypothetical protein